MTKRGDKCRYCGGGALDLINHELHCVMNDSAKEPFARRRDMPHVNVELYIKLMDMLQEFQLPGGKFDGHGLITTLANAKRFDVIKSENAKLREALSRMTANYSAVVHEAGCGCFVCEARAALTQE